MHFSYLEPLAELQVVLIFCPNKFFHVDMSLNAMFGEGNLEKLKNSRSAI